MLTPGSVRERVAALALGGKAAKGKGKGAGAGTAAGGSPPAGGMGTPGSAAPAGRSYPSRNKVLMLAGGIIVVIAVASIAAATLAAGPSGTRAAAAHHNRPHTTVPAVPLTVESVTEGGQTRNADGAQSITVQLSTPLSASSPLPTVRPATPGSWSRAGDLLTFTPTMPFQPGSEVRVKFAAGQAGLRSAAGGLLATKAQYRLYTAQWSTLRLDQLLAQLGYLPLTWTPQLSTGGMGTGRAGGSSQATGMAAQLADVYSPPAGGFSWQPGYPSILSTFWSQGEYNLILDGAIRAFQSTENLTMTGLADTTLWHDLMQAAAKGQVNPNGYTYALASKASPETLTVWHNGKVVLDTLANTGIPAAPTADGTNPVYLRYKFQIMRGTNPDGTKYADPVSWVAYFNGGEAVHYFPRGSYGFAQSLGCVELPYAQAEQVWPYLTYGSLVTVAG